MPPSEWTRMAVASAVAVAAVSFLAIDVAVDVNPGVIAKRIEMARASIADAAVSQHQLAFAAQAWARRSHQKQPLEQCLAVD